jgi:hypothetical protein
MSRKYWIGVSSQSDQFRRTYSKHSLSPLNATTLTKGSSTAFPVGGTPGKRLSSVKIKRSMDVPNDILVNFLDGTFSYTSRKHVKLLPWYG